MRNKIESKHQMRSNERCSEKKTQHENEKQFRKNRIVIFQSSHHAHAHAHIIGNLKLYLLFL